MNITATNKGFQTISLLLFLGLFTACGGSGGGNDGGGGGGTADTTAPTITLTGDNPQTIEVGTAYTELGATAQDNVDGDISANIATDSSAVDTSTAGSYSVTYNVSDAAGNAAATQTRTVNVIAVADTTAPVITLVGDNPQSVVVGTAYTELGATAQDNVDGDISANITTDSSAVDTSTIGNYSVTYDVSDAAGNAATTQTRAVDVVAALSDNADLNNLTLSNGSLSPAFTSQTTNYGASVTNAISSITVTPTSTDVNASISVNGSVVNSGSASGSLALAVGNTDISIVVTAEDGNSTVTYTVTVTREASLSNDADLSNLSLSSGSLTPAFDAATLNYTASVSFTSTAITVTPTLSDSNASVTVNGTLVSSGAASAAINLDEGNNTITLVVLAEDSSVQTYTVIISRQAAAEFAQQAYIKASNTDQGDTFGDSVAIDGDTLVIGATSEDSNATGVGGDENNNDAVFSGAVYVFFRSGSTWTQQAYIKASNTDASDSFGASVALEGDTLAVGARGEDSNATGIGGDETNNDATSSGAVYVFTRSGSTWTQQAYIKASNTDGFDKFGASVALTSETLVVGAIGEGSNATGIGQDENNNDANGSGAVYVFTRNGSTWTQQTYIKASNTDADDGFGESVALAGDTLAVGARGEDSNATGIGGNPNNFSPSSGAVYVFTRSAGIWAQQAYIKASNPDLADVFGISLALDGDTLAVGAPNEDSNATGIDGDQGDNTAGNSGAVYVFTRSGSTWSQQAYIKTSNAEAGDGIGNSVSLNGDTMAVGAPGEGSNATGVGGDENNNDAGASGAVYVFTRIGSTWTQQAYIKASNTDATDLFGNLVVLADGSLVVGALLESSNATGVDGNQGDNSLSGAGAVYVFNIPAIP